MKLHVNLDYNTNIVPVTQFEPDSVLMMLCRIKIKQKIHLHALLTTMCEIIEIKTPFVGTDFACLQSVYHILQAVILRVPYVHNNRLQKCDNL